MNTAKLRSKRVLIPTVAAVAVLAIGGVTWASTASANDLQGSERDRVSSAAVEAVGGGTAIDIESSDDAGEAYEVEVRKDDGTEVEVTLDKSLKVLSEEAGGDKGRDDRDGDDANDTPEADDRALSSTERTSAERAALAAVEGGTVTQVEASDDRGESYEVDVRKADNTEWDVTLDADFKVVNKSMDN